MSKAFFHDPPSWLSILQGGEGPREEGGPTISYPSTLANELLIKAVQKQVRVIMAFLPSAPGGEQSRSSQSRLAKGGDTPAS